MQGDTLKGTLEELWGFIERKSRSIITQNRQHALEYLCAVSGSLFGWKIDLMLKLPENHIIFYERSKMWKRNSECAKEMIQIY